MTQALWRNIIGVALNKKLMQWPKINSHLQKLHFKTTVPRRRLFYYVEKALRLPHQRKNPSISSGVFVGGAAGYRTRVRKVTGYSSTHVVSLGCLRYV